MTTNTLCNGTFTIPAIHIPYRSFIRGIALSTHFHATRHLLLSRQSSQTWKLKRSRRQRERQGLQMISFLFNLPSIFDFILYIEPWKVYIEKLDIIEKCEPWISTHAERALARKFKAINTIKQETILTLMQEIFA